MKKSSLALLIGAGITFSSVAASDEMADLYFSADNPILSKEEQRALQISNKWMAGATPATGNAGAISFVFGVQQPSIVCAILQVCDVALQAGEVVNSIHLGDSARWNIEPAITGVGSQETQHLIIKPSDVGLETSLIVTTDRRTYHIRLKSHRTEYMPHVVFSYPEDAVKKWNNIKQQVRVEKSNRTLDSGEYLGSLDFEYRVSGNSPWVPSRVYNDGRKTIIEMPKVMENAPTLLVVTEEGGLFTDDEVKTVNYRVQGHRYIVDSLFDKALLIDGVGDKQHKVTIERGN